MSDEAAFHEGYCKAIVEARALLEGLGLERDEEMETLLEELQRREEKARCLSRSSLAAGASGKAGY